MNKAKDRMSNFELMRIISMLMIVLWHIIGHGYMMENSEGLLHFVIRVILFLIVVHVNSFVLVSGYFQYKSKISWYKVLHLFCLQWFYKSLLTIIFSLCGWHKMTGVDLFNNLWPFDNTENYWFINCYLVLYIMSPLINKFIENINQREHRYTLIISFFLFSIIPMITNNYTIANNGYSVIHFIFLYLMGAYLHKYPIKENIHFKNFSKNKRQIIFLAAMFFIAMVNLSFSISADFLMTYDNEVIRQFATFYNNFKLFYSNILVLIQSVLYFLFFETLSIKSKKINKIAKYTLPVYLISENLFVRQHLYYWLKIDKMRPISSFKYIPYIFICTIGIFIVCCIIEWIRKIIFKFLKKIKLYHKVKNKVLVYINDI